MALQAVIAAPADTIPEAQGPLLVTPAQLPRPPETRLVLHHHTHTRRVVSCMLHSNSSICFKSDGITFCLQGRSYYGSSSYYGRRSSCPAGQYYSDMQHIYSGCMICSPGYYQVNKVLFRTDAFKDSPAPSPLKLEQLWLY